jgi:hypothetical protein
MWGDLLKCWRGTVEQEEQQHCPNLLLDSFYTTYVKEMPRDLCNEVIKKKRKLEIIKAETQIEREKDRVLMIITTLHRVYKEHIALKQKHLTLHCL